MQKGLASSQLSKAAAEVACAGRVCVVVYVYLPASQDRIQNKAFLHCAAAPHAYVYAYIYYFRSTCELVIATTRKHLH